MKGKDVQNDLIKGTYGIYQPVLTNDNTWTLHSPLYKENCHSTSGAVQETLYNYVEGTQVLKKLKKQTSLSIFELGLGTGLGFRATIEEVKKFLKREKGKTKTINFVSSEIDEKLAFHFLKLLLEEKFIEDVVLTNNQSGLRYFKSSFTIKEKFMELKGQLIVLIGNVRETFPRYQSLYPIKFDCFYHDPFSPKKNAILWTTEFFEMMKMAACEKSVLSTYSSTKAVWKALIKAGWKVCEVKGYGKKKLSTRAYIVGESSEFVIDQCSRSPSPALSDTLLPEGLNPFL